MPKTPDRFPGEADEEGIRLEDVGLDPTVVGEIRRNGSDFKAKDGLGVFNLRAVGSVPPANLAGQVLFSVDGTTFSAQTPLTCSGWLVSDPGVLLVVG